jgi:hypothetical protein
MMKHGKIVGAALFMSALLVALPGCEKQEGPLEKAGKEVDQAVEDMGQPKEGPLEQAGQAVDDATEKLGEQVEKTGDNIQDAAKGDN